MVHTASLEEWLVPVVVFVIWAINAAISVAKKKSEEENGGESPQRPFTPLNHPANDDTERTRRIQEEIRRKIAERRGEVVPPSAADTSPAYPQEQPPPLRRTAERMPSPLEAPRPMTSPREVAHRRPTYAPDAGPVYREQPEPRNDYLAQLEAQRRQIEESERQAEAIRRQARAQAARRKAKPILKKTTSAGAGLPSIRGSLKRELRDPAAIRKAVLHYEILGTPMGMRRDGQLYPHWEV
ncbi:MAG: hypothetical protein Q7Q73_13160 [Verrucomicrobiota bacterium JB024]|nr:hypothetical protein [Verrucomicrobiota bacterium JB024]